jgi:integrase
VKDRKQFEVEPATRPTSIEEIVRNELSYETQKGKPYEVIEGKAYKPESIEDLLKRVYEHIERQALEVYKSNEIWALRRWCLENLLKDEIVNEATVEVADGLIKPVLDWQEEQPLDPIAFYRHRLVHTLRKKPKTVKCYMITASRFVAKMGRKTHYSDDEVLEYLDWAGEHFSKSQSSYIHECTRLQQFLRNLPGAKRDYKLPIDFNNLGDIEYQQPMWSDEEIEMICWASVLDKLKPDMVTRIAVASIYGGRRGELAQLSSEDFYLDGQNSYIFIKTAKRGVRKKQPIPRSLVPLFSAPIEPISDGNLHNKLKRVIRKAEVHWKPRSGFHSFRRNVVTMLDKTTQSDLAKYKFMRWSTPRHLGLLDRYRRIPTEITDTAILNEHPRVRLWEQIIPYLVQFNPHYHSLIDIME